jgi:hypothetical protein
MYLRTIFAEMKSQIQNIEFTINSAKADEIVKNRGRENVKWSTYGSIYSLLTAESVAKVERLGSAIGLNAHDMISFLTLKSYDFKYYLSLVK